MSYYKPTTTQIGSIFHGLANIYSLVFGEKNRGVFVEFGASDGESHSNTNFLADMGWKGLYIEPIPSVYKLCKERHKNNSEIIVENYAVTNKDGGSIEISLSACVANGDGSFSTTDFESREFNKNNFANIMTDEIIEVEQISLRTILLKHNIEKYFDLLVIDTDGNERQIIEAFDINEFLPKMVIVEMNEYGNYYNFQVEDKKFIFDYFYKAGYRVIYKDLINTIFVRDKLSEQAIKNEVKKKWWQF